MARARCVGCRDGLFPERVSERVPRASRASGGAMPATRRSGTPAAQAAQAPPSRRRSRTARRLSLPTAVLGCRRRSAPRAGFVGGQLRRHVLDQRRRQRFLPFLSMRCASGAACSTTTAVTASTHLSSGRPITAHSRHRRVAQQRVLDLARIDVVAAADDHVRGTVLQVEEAVRVEHAHVARAYPPIGQESLRGQLGRVVVAGHARGRAHGDFARLARRHRMAGLVDRLQLHLQRDPLQAPRRSPLWSSGAARPGSGTRSGRSTARSGAGPRLPWRASITRAASAKRHR